MKISLYQVEACTDCLFRGSPPAVCRLPHWLSDETLLSITYENNLPATAFLAETMTSYEFRWVSPTEIPLCGHGTLAAAYVIFNMLNHYFKQCPYILLRVCWMSLLIMTL